MSPFPLSLFFLNTNNFNIKNPRLLSKNSEAMNNLYTIFPLLIIFFLPAMIHAECTCDSDHENRNKAEALKYKLVAIVTILLAGGIGVCIPLLGKIIPSLRPENDIFFLIKAFAAGVILATGFVHVLPHAFESLTGPCLGENGPWGDFPFTGLVAMSSAVGTMMVETIATSYCKKSHLSKAQPVNEIGDEEKEGQVVHVHTQGHAAAAHGYASSDNSTSPDLLRHRIVSQVLELGIVVHSVIIGISLGASLSPKTIKPLMAALTFHQLFEGMSLGSCISQAKFKARTIATMSIFFSLTTPIGIVIGFGISNIYDVNSPTSLIVEGMFSSASAGILIYMALVDLLAADFMNSKLQYNLKLQLGAYLSLLLGSGFMSLLAKWA